jgi:hypothetical protein
VSYRHAGNPRDLEKAKPEIVTPTEAEWKAFQAALDAMNVWNWKSNYDAPNIDDGTQWEVAMKFGGKKIVSRGSNAYPDGKGGVETGGKSKAFTEFLGAISTLLGGKTFQ